MLYVLYSIHAEKGNEILMIEDSRFRVQGSRFKVQGVQVAASPRSMAQAAAILAFVISHTTFLAAQDDETGRCPKAGG